MITNGLAKYAYEHLGAGAIDFAEGDVAMTLDVALEVAVGRAYAPESFPAYGDTPTIASIASKVVGGLLAAGWTPPEDVPLMAADERRISTFGDAYASLTSEYLRKCRRAIADAS